MGHARVGVCRSACPLRVAATHLPGGRRSNWSQTAIVNRFRGPAKKDAFIDADIPAAKWPHVERSSRGCRSQRPLRRQNMAFKSFTIAFHDQFQRHFFGRWLAALCFGLPASVSSPLMLVDSRPEPWTGSGPRSPEPVAPISHILGSRPRNEASGERRTVPQIVRSRSAITFAEKYKTREVVRVSEKNFSHEGGVRSVPLYAAY